MRQTPTAESQGQRDGVKAWDQCICSIMLTHYYFSFNVCMRMAVYSLPSL